jgi:hypothetical protein
MSLVVLTALAVLLLGLVHGLTPRLHFLEGTPRSIWLSIAGGVSVAYVFVHLLPELAQGQRDISSEVAVRAAERHVYLIALFGLLVFYGLDRLAKVARSKRAGVTVADGRRSDEEPPVDAGPKVFWIHMASFGIYNALIGYLLLHREQMTRVSLGFFVVAMALHFLVTDYGLNEDHKQLYRRFGWWVLCAALGVGWLVGTQLSVNKAAIAAVTAFVGGGVVLNILKEEVPSERQSRFWAFALGAVVYSALLLTL